MISLPQRQQMVQWIEQASAAGARRHQACELLGIAPRTLQRWQQCGALSDAARSTRSFVPANKQLAVPLEPFRGSLPSL
jgi:hypothetical protein